MESATSNKCNSSALWYRARGMSACYAVDQLDGNGSQEQSTVSAVRQGSPVVACSSFVNSGKLRHGEVAVWLPRSAVDKDPSRSRILHFSVTSSFLLNPEPTRLKHSQRFLLFPSTSTRKDRSTQVLMVRWSVARILQHGCDCTRSHVRMTKLNQGRIGD